MDRVQWPHANDAKAANYRNVGVRCRRGVRLLRSWPLGIGPRSFSSVLSFSGYYYVTRDARRFSTPLSLLAEPIGGGIRRVCAASSRFRVWSVITPGRW